MTQTAVSRLLLKTEPHSGKEQGKAHEILDKHAFRIAKFINSEGAHVFDDEGGAAGEDEGGADEDCADEGGAAGEDEGGADEDGAAEGGADEDCADEGGAVGSEEVINLPRWIRYEEIKYRLLSDNTVRDKDIGTIVFIIDPEKMKFVKWVNEEFHLQKIKERVRLTRAPSNMTSGDPRKPGAASGPTRLASSDRGVET
eukprot:SAG11_NODE_2210_length_3683_cov_5.278181_2_plen_199_part_00